MQQLRNISAQYVYINMFSKNCFCSQDGRTALHLAATYGNYEIVKVLVSAYADVDNTTIKVSTLPVLLSGGSPVSSW